MASFWDGLLGGSDPTALYGDIFTPEQKQALKYRQFSDTLGELAAGFGKAAMPSPVRLGLGAVLGTAAGGLGANQDKAVEQMLTGGLTAEKIKEARRIAAWRAKFEPLLWAEYQRTMGGQDGTSPPPETVPPGPPEAVPPAVPPGMPPVVPPGVPVGPAPPVPEGLLASGTVPNGAGAAARIPPELYSLLRGTSGPGAALPPEAAPPAPPSTQFDTSQYTPQQLAALRARNQIDPVTGRPNLPPESFKVNSRGLPYSVEMERMSPQERARAAEADRQLKAGTFWGPQATQAPQQQTGLLPPPDQYIPQGGPGILGGGAIMPASYGGGAGAPLPFRQASSSAGPPGGGVDPGRQGRVDFWMSRGAPRHVAEGIADRVNAESGFDPSIMGDSGTSGGLYQHHADRLTNLKRFAAQQGKPWTDPGVQDQFAASEVTGGDATATKGWSEILNAPDRQTAARLWDRYFERSKSGPGSGGPDIVLPREGGPRLSRDMLTNAQYSPNAPGAQYVPPGGGLNDPIPGLGMSPKQISLLDAMAEMAGMKTPFKELLDSYYKTPGYVAEVERTKTQAQKDIELKMDPLILEQRKRAEYKVDMELKPELDAAVARLQSPILKEREQAKADIDRLTNQLKSAGDAALRPNEATIVGPGGVLTTQKITDLEFAKRQQARAERIAKGDTSMQPGDIVGTPIGAAPAEHQYIMTPQGSISAAPVPGTPAAQKAAETEAKKLQTEHAKLISRDTVVREVDNISKLMEDAIFPTGFVGSIMQNIGGTAANDIRVARQTLESRLSTDAINAQRAASPTGAAFGNTSDTDMAILRTALVNLDQSQTKQQFKDRLQILKQAYVDAVHGPGMSRLLPETQVLKTPESPREWKDGDIANYPDGSQQQLRNGTWVETRPPRK